MLIIKFLKTILLKLRLFSHDPIVSSEHPFKNLNKIKNLLFFFPTSCTLDIFIHMIWKKLVLVTSPIHTYIQRDLLDRSVARATINIISCRLRKKVYMILIKLHSKAHGSIYL
jgi:hypothetical protein